ncbi:DoxX family protein [Candidatus Acetothermia bacterium]|nr:DoxX family protein [Candidatus Acetothermia bacterium]
MLAKIFQDQRDIALLLIRIAFGLIFCLYGWRHVTGLEGYTATFANRFHIPFPNVLAPLVAWVELLGGAAALFGFFVRYAGILLAVVMVVSTFAVKLPAGLAKGGDILGLTGFWDVDLSLFTMGITLLLMGPGRYALEQFIFKREL